MHASTSAVAETTLIVEHVPNSNPASFRVVRLTDGKNSQAESVSSPVGFPVEGRPNSDLMRELQWYLEVFLDYPYSPETEHAERVLKALRDWGEQAFRALFDNRAAGRMFENATNDYSKLHLVISSDDAQVLAWPWEALRDPELGVLGHTCQVERRLNTVRDAQALSSSLPQDRVNILMVVARPYGKQDVKFRSIARPLVELIEQKKLPAHVELLRPPTFDQLRQHLKERPGFYHILHFDGHGAYEAAGSGSGFKFQGPEGKLVFETEEGTPDEITAEKLSTLLQECAVPGVVLNACQSAMIDPSGKQKDSFSSVATALLRSGMREVVAMAYSLYVSGAKVFLPAFYGRLFEKGSMAQAVRAGRQQMYKDDQRICARGEFPLQDWLLPVLYQQSPLSFPFATAAAKLESRPSKLPEELRRDKNPYGFIGRDSALLEMERALRRPPAGILIQGLGGVGKTTLARGLLQWMDQTGGLKHEPWWFSFQEIRSAEFVFNRIGEALFGGNFSALNVKLEEKVAKTAEVLRDEPQLIVWDNFESASGIPGSGIEPNLRDSDRKLLAQFLDDLRGGATKVIITSRSPEDWLGPARRFHLPLGGLDREERWEYCQAILRDLGKTINRNDKDIVDLMDLLGGHPLAMRAILPRLEKLSAAQVLAALRSNLDSLKLDEAEEGQKSLYATLAFVEQSLAEELRPLLGLLGMHEGFLDANYLEVMAKRVDAKWSRRQIDTFLATLVLGGLVWEVGEGIYELHPLLTSYLRFRLGRRDLDIWARAFAIIMGNVAYALTDKPLHEQRQPFHLHGQSFYRAQEEAERFNIADVLLALTQALARFSQNSRNFVMANRLFQSMAKQLESSGQQGAAASAYHHLGMIACEQGDFQASEHWCHKALTIQEEKGDVLGASSSYHQLGTLALEQRELATAEEWYRKALAVSEKHNYQRNTANTCHQLGMVAQEKRDFAAAEQWHCKSLAAEEALGDEQGAATTYHHLGMIAQQRRDFEAAHQFYCKSLEIAKKNGNRYMAAVTYYQLGMLAQDRRDFGPAAQWYRESLAISEEDRNEALASDAYHQLGILAQYQLSFDMAEQWYRKSLRIKEKQNNDYSAAITYHHLGMLAHERLELDQAEKWYRKALSIKERQGSEHGAALTYGQLGILAGMKGNLLEGGHLLIKCISILRRVQDQHLAQSNTRNFLVVYKKASAQDQPKLASMWREAGLGELPKID
ncbi:MAG TPA: tetratricopeptide repeat protein [Candidatus Angelobacter sp.]|jgi:tetratricopeptide (TPR) repeat protein|nr:tetratricopeptide repeat protein [Candidatus Angelobacter sp.]